jgi:hypothetical protein
MEGTLPLIWAPLIAIAVFLYVCMDGFDLGVGILFPVMRGKADRDTMVNTVAPVWDGNETWLVLGGGGLYAVFPLAYATIMPALYMPVLVMLLALVFRGVAFEMRFRADTERSQLWWDRAFSWGSYAAAFCQGIMLGALVQGVRVEGRAYAGGWWDWLTLFSVLTGLALVIGYGRSGPAGWSGRPRASCRIGSGRWRAGSACSPSASLRWSASSCPSCSRPSASGGYPSPTCSSPFRCRCWSRCSPGVSTPRSTRARTVPWQASGR